MASGANIGNSISYSGVTGFGTVVTSSGSSTTPSISVPSASGQMVAQAFGGYLSGLSSYNQTQRYYQIVESNVNLTFLMGDALGASRVSFTCSEANSPWGAIGVPLIP
jgi:hypothetical protein